MHQDISSIVASIVTISITLYFVGSFLYGAFGYSKHTIEINDNFEIGYIEKNQSEFKPTSIENAKVIDLQNKLNKLEKTIDRLNKKQPIEKKVVDHLQKDCIDALVSLGHKKHEAIQIVADYCSNNTIQTVENFITDYFTRKKQ